MKCLLSLHGPGPGGPWPGSPQQWGTLHWALVPAAGHSCPHSMVLQGRPASDAGVSSGLQQLLSTYRHTSITLLDGMLKAHSTGKKYKVKYNNMEMWFLFVITFLPLFNFHVYECFSPVYIYMCTLCMTVDSLSHHVGAGNRNWQVFFFFKESISTYIWETHPC